MKILKKGFSLFLTCTIILSLFSGMGLTALAAPGTNPSYSKEADRATLDGWKAYFGTTHPSTENAGAVWTDKSVFADNSAFMGLTDANNHPITPEVAEDSFLVALSALASNKSVVGHSSIPTDTVLLLDISGSMGPKINDAVADLVLAANAVAIVGGMAQLFGILFSGGYFIAKKCFFSVRITRRDVLDIIRFGVPAGMSILSYNLSVTLTTGFVTRLGVSVINTKVYVDNIVNYTSKISYALGNANAILTGRHRGNNHFDAIKRLFRQNLCIAILSNLVLSLLVLFFHRPLLSIFTDDAVIIALAFGIMALDIPVEIFRAMNHVEEFALNANGDVRTTFITSVFSGWVCNVLLAYVFTVVLDYGLTGIWIAKMVDEGFKSMVYFIRWKTGRWMLIKI